MATICLNMIVRNEAPVIRRCLESVRPLIDHWLVVDTGSSDDTPDVVRETLDGVPGDLVQRPWKDFGHNRNEALDLGRPHADYLLTIDADEELVIPQDFVMPELDAGGYEIRQEISGSEVVFYRIQLIRADLPWRWVGRVHEVLHCDAEAKVRRLPDVTNVGFYDSTRNVDRQAKFESDVRLLQLDLEERPDDPRTVFYLAQSLRDSGDPEGALRYFTKRVQLGGWDEERWYAAFQTAAMAERLGRQHAIVLDAYLGAFALRPTRAEPLCELARYLRQSGDFALAYVYAAAAVTIDRPTSDILFIDDSIYRWRALDELAVACHWIGRFARAEELYRRLLDECDLPAAERPRVERNLELVRNRREIGGETSAGTTPSSPGEAE
jgi:glycosyltransferase involved in cell wall biosynthesis